MNGEMIQNNIREYLGIRIHRNNPFADLLRQAVDKAGKSVFDTQEQLRQTLLEVGANEVQITQIYLMTQVPGFPRLITPKVEVTQSELERYIHNALEKTGFQRALVLELTTAIALAINIAFDYSERPKRSTNAERAYVVPSCVYREDLQRIKANVEKGALEEGDFGLLSEMMAADVTEAKYLFGKWMLTREDADYAKEKGISALEEAAESGYAPGAAFLGDYYFNQGNSESLNKAYEYYTGYGALALSNQGQKAVVQLLNQKIQNKKTLCYSAVLALVMLVMMVVAPGEALYANHMAIGGLCMVVILARLLISVLHFRKHPFGEVYLVPCTMMVIWSIYMTSRFLL